MCEIENIWYENIATDMICFVVLFSFIVYYMQWMPSNLLFLVGCQTRYVHVQNDIFIELESSTFVTTLVI